MISKIKKLSFMLHPLLFSIFPILFLFTHNIDQMYFRDILLPTGIVIGFTFISLFVLFLLLKNKDKAGIVTTVFFILFFSYGHFWRFFDGFKIRDLVIGKHLYLLSFWGIIMAVVVFLIYRTSRSLEKIAILLNLTACSLIMFSVINIGAYQFSNINSGRQAGLSELGKTSYSKNGVGSPDIYYIILDGYASNNTLREVYNYDNSDFTDYLESKGFFVAYESCSNYPMTTLSLASSLNMEYVNYFSETIGEESRLLTVPFQMIRNNKVMSFLKSRGYTFIHFGSGSGATKWNEYSDIDIDSGKLDEFKTFLIQTTILLPFIEKLNFFELSRKRILNTFDILPKIAKDNSPTYTFVHLITPHPPYLFDQDGMPVPKEDLNLYGSVWLDKEHYLNQLIFTNKKMKILIESILSKSKVPPVIILQADHGSASTFNYPGENDVNDITEYMLKERFGILNAYLIPDVNQTNLYDSISPVNTFRLIFNIFFNTKYQLLDDRSYYSSYTKPYKFIEVSGQIRY